MRGSARCAARDRVRKGETLPSRTAVSQTRHDRTPDRRCVHGRPHLSGDHVRRTRPALPAMPPHHHDATQISTRAPRGLPQWQLAVRMAGVTNTDSASTSPGSGSFEEPTTLRPRSSGPASVERRTPLAAAGKTKRCFGARPMHSQETRNRRRMFPWKWKHSGGRCRAVQPADTMQRH